MKLLKQDPRLQGRAPGFRQDRIGTRQGKDRDKSDKEKKALKSLVVGGTCGDMMAHAKIWWLGK